jgi:hypothetical protein
MKELQNPLGGNNSLALMRRIMHFSFNTRPANTIFGKTNIFF